MTATSERTPLITPDWHISGRAYRDADVFDEELNDIFYSGWVYVAHASELKNPGDYKTTRVGSQPLIVNRDADSGEVNVMFNRCRHRGAAVCQLESGNANFFRCAYHGWTYRSNGRLTGVPFEDGYGPDLDKSTMGLIHVPRVAEYAGFIFCSLAESGPSLEEHLGNARRYLDFMAENEGGIELTAGVQRVTFDGNWKLQMENTIDPYHFSFTHKSWLEVLETRTGNRGEFLNNVLSNPDWQTVDLGNGHSAQEFGPWKGGGSHAGVGSVLPFSLVIFPNLGFVGAQIRVIQPIAVNHTDVLVYPLMQKDASAETNAATLREHEAFYGPAGMGLTDDVEVGFDRVTAGQSANLTDADWTNMSRGVTREQPGDDGIVVGHVTDELPQRAFYREWMDRLSSESRFSEVAR